ncbi:plasmid recombination protein [Duganella sp. BuS-21]|uniref:plasmid recombination protein n=1 Tax=Duganella sp. BuS-21 TaxID=2943848 RepID=UPI0035A73EAA
MTDALYLRIKSLNTRTVRGVTSPKNIVRVAALHNLREIQAELGANATSGINPARMHLNYQLRGPATADDVAGLALALLDNAGVQSLRRDACMALELVVSVPADTTIDHRAYFSAAVAWADAHFNVPILSAAVHLDEAAPHCHILLLPLVAGRMQGGALAGGPAKIRAMLADFQQQVAQRFGLTHQPRAKRLSKPNRDASGRMVLDALRARPERMSEPGMRDALISALGSQAETLLALLGLSMPTTKEKAKSFADIMTAPCKPDRTRRAASNTMHIDVAQNLSNQDGKKFDNVYVSVDVAPSPSPNPAGAQPLQPATDQATGTADQRQHSAENLAQQQAAQVEQREARTGAADQSAEGMQSPLHTSASTTGQAAPTSASTAPAKRKRTATSRHSADTGGVRKISAPPEPCRAGRGRREQFCTHHAAVHRPRRQQRCIQIWTHAHRCGQRLPPPAR